MSIRRPQDASITNDEAIGRLFRLSTGVFLMGGFVSSLSSLLVPRLRLGHNLDYMSATLIQLASHSGYLFLALPIAAIIVRQGYMRAHAAGLGIMGAGLLGIILAAALSSFPITFIALCVLSAGSTFLQIASNTVVAVVGDPRRAAMRLNILQGLNPIGTVLGPLLGAPVVLSFATFGFGVPLLAMPFGLAALAVSVLALLFWHQRFLLRKTTSADTRGFDGGWSTAMRN